MNKLTIILIIGLVAFVAYAAYSHFQQSGPDYTIMVTPGFISGNFTDYDFTITAGNWTNSDNCSGMVFSANESATNITLKLVAP